MWTILLWLFTFSFIVAYVSAVIDARIIRLKYGKIVSLNHTSRNIIRGVIFTGSTLLVCNSLFEFMLLLVLQSLRFSLFFDIILNYKRGLSPWYIGKTSFLDILIRNLYGGDGGFTYATFKCLFIQIITYIYVACH